MTLARLPIPLTISQDEFSLYFVTTEVFATFYNQIRAIESPLIETCPNVGFMLYCKTEEQGCSQTIQHELGTRECQRDVSPPWDPIARALANRRHDASESSLGPCQRSKEVCTREKTACYSHLLVLLFVFIPEKKAQLGVAIGGTKNANILLACKWASAYAWISAKR